MQDKIEELERLIEASEVSHHECAALITLLRQIKFYVSFKANSGDLYAQNLAQQIMKESSNVA